MFTIQIKTSEATDRLLEEMPNEWKASVFKGVKKALIFAETQAKKSFGKQGHLKSRSGKLRRSIKYSVKERFDTIFGALSSDVVYAPIHEYGGVIRAKNEPYLKFSIGGRWMQVKQVTIPARPYLEPAIKENLSKMSNIITDTIQKEMN